MKRIVLALTLMAMATSCAQRVQTPCKPEIKVDNGQFTPEIMHQMGKISDIQVSDDGKKILYGISYTSIEDNSSTRHLYVMNVDGSDNRQVTSGDKSQSNGRWMEGDSRIAYLEDGQIWICAADGSSAHKVSDIEGGISEFKFSPDCKYVMYSSDFKVAKKPSDLYPDLDKADARTVENLMYRHWDHFVESIPHTWFAPFDGNEVGEGKDILEGEPFELPAEPFSGLEQLSFAPQSHQIAYSCRKLTGRDYAFSTNSDIFIYNMENGCQFNMSEGNMGYDTDPVFSPDDSKVAWLSMERNGYEADKVRIFVGEILSGERYELTGNFKYDASSLVWTPESDALYFSSEVEGVKEIWKVDLKGNLTRITPEHEWVDFSTPALAGDKLITTYTSMMHPAEIAAISLTDGSWEQISHENDNVINALEQCTMEERRIPTTDGKQMHMWVIYPPHFDSSKVYPAIEVCLGGPQSSHTQGWSTRWNYRLMASQGYIVFLPNRRGTKAFGQEWCEQISGDYCGQNILDYLSAADAMKAEPYVGKMAAVGASYGGYSIYYLAGVHQNRFSAFVAHAGIFNQESMYMTTEEMFFADWDNGGCKRPGTYMAGSPWSNNPFAVRHYSNSPHKLIQNWNTPILITHGEKDYRVPVEQGMSAFNAAQMFGCPSKMILFPEENHWILKPQNSIHWNREFFAWLDQWCK